jgi:hypothetical protein
LIRITNLNRIDNRGADRVLVPVLLEVSSASRQRVGGAKEERKEDGIELHVAMLRCVVSFLNCVSKKRYGKVWECTDIRQKRDSTRWKKNSLTKNPICHF